ncbi:MAG: two-component sensor histidine kinase [Sulfurimonas sp. RIFCSPHIGHO2_12_FULL_36_9]|uniref:sensor histidine kinase n=1 Tax=Sulfurimonas sp. RIFCSPLOWO2_12_36_12 TaxID=1802253 RepID=UPI0008AD1587|nr:HAMP domain-containing sensor histidine kinase [Sulfurimonas sp. RIFCSPLOWO2_12_36_12]OHD96872.1 MAG: two-component sensor histidine kinase [Sulfurimonas sp. RIFCSPHIGHO2_12_FULL_36_9]OHD97470.1 MAG: two-component sensor histidine kinase [Sulfurimonas sp. RIFCSPLOWO2_02_FULL_36_28]OHE01600.1 MAG: two-component sensor histidine kinase [Sulfurimonas sp. RIFCSPLOWO2_12_36_12]OHE07621.1 MAG: two-component sensor histidine kinase [Sulfurimonas sp. RIFCSPLOWO2_12_FULL_36_74]
MFSKRSIRLSFLIQLIIASFSLILIFSSILYFYIEKSIFNEKHQELLVYANNVASNESIYGSEVPTPDIYLGLSIEIMHLNKEHLDIDLYETTKDKKSYLTLIYPFNLDELSYLKITKDVTATRALLDKILHYLFIINIAGFLLVVIYAIGLSKMLVAPVKTLSNKLSNMNEHLMRPIKVEELPEEFEPLGATINHLIARIQNFVKYQKELFIGTAHELKTPLAVIKLKNQVTLIKKRSAEEYIDALKVTNKTIDEMNIIVSNILNIGRQEGMQLEKPQEVDVIKILTQKADDFKLLAANEGKTLYMHFEPDGFMAILQVGLLNQIVQNFLQNALKFTPKDKNVTLKSSLNNYGLLIEVIDEGCGIDESSDLFAPFKREGNKPGVGLGLFLAKSAADALGAKISIKNRTDGVVGTIASLNLNSKLSCILPTN